MKKRLLFLCLTIANVNLVYSQIIAGNAATGLIISNPAVSFSVSTVLGYGTGSFDLNCDSIADISVELYKGPTAIDGSNYAFLHVLNPVFMVCADTINFQPRKINYFNLGDSIVCPPTADWYNDSTIQLGNYGCMDCPGPFSATNLYLGYKNTNTAQIGWIKISFNLIDGGSMSPITLSVPEVLSPCFTTSVSASTSTSTPTYTNSGVGTCGTFTYSIAYAWPSCYGYCDGGISITGVSGGVSPYNYLWTPGMQNGSSIGNLCSGAYYFMISDANGNSCASNFLIQDPPPVTFSLSSTNVSCNGGNDGSICCSVSGGSGPYTYSWSPIGGNTSCITGLFAGNYALCVTDVNGCIACSNAIVNEPTAIQVTETIMPTSCASCCDGELQLQISGGTPAYSINYFPAAPSCPGTYTYNVTDSKGCTRIDSVLISFATSVPERNLKKTFDVFPNPTRGELSIKCHVGSNKADIQLINALGEIVWDAGNSTYDLLVDISDQPNGIYILTFHLDGLFSSVKIVKE